MKGIDISTYQRNVNYSKLKEQGIEFAIIRLGFGKNISQKDEMFEEHFQGLKNAGIKVGAYLYSYAYVKEGAKLEAENTLEIIKGKQFDLPIFYDMEESKQALLGKEVLTEMANEWCRIIKNAGYKAGVYANLNWFKNNLNPYEIASEFNFIWLALWNNDEKPNVQFPVAFWQYTSNGHLDGIEGKVDLDKCFVESFQQPVDNIVYKTNEDLATEVIQGKWGNGRERKDRLTKAGYNYNEIQKIVNERLLGNKKSNYDLATEVIQGKWGNGRERKDRLTKAGYNYNEIQKIVNERLLGK
ncbi:MAG: GH25 family lysozyme [Clostridia bacterium]